MIVPPGAAVLLDLAEYGDSRCLSGHQLLVVMVPRQGLRDAMASVEDRVGTVIPAGNDALRLLVHTARGLHSDAGLSDPAVLAAGGRHLRDLMMLALGTNGGDAAAEFSGRMRAVEVALQRGRRAARLRLAMDYVSRHLGDAELTAARVGRHLAISTRAMQMHFEGAGMTFSGFLLEQRLLRVLGDLRDPRCDAKTVAELAFAAGFHDISHFNRCFRRRFGDTPSGVRSAAR